MHAPWIGLIVWLCGPSVGGAAEPAPWMQSAAKTSAVPKVSSQGNGLVKVAGTGTVLPGYTGTFDGNRALTPADVALWTPAQMRVRRNEVYARYGRGFQSADLQQHFGATDWYQVVPTYDDRLLTETDKANVAVIRSFEAAAKDWSGQEDMLMFISDTELVIVEGDSMYGDVGGERHYVARGASYVITWTGAATFGLGADELELWTRTGTGWKREKLHPPVG